jgi:hypothetical protein
MIDIKFFSDGYGKVYPFVNVSFWEAWRLFGIRELIVRVRYKWPIVSCELARMKLIDVSHEPCWIDCPQVASDLEEMLWIR